MPLDKKRDPQAGDVFTASEIVRVTYLEQGSRRARKEKKPGRTLINGERIDFKDYLDTGLAASVWKVGNKYYVGFAGTNPLSEADLVTDLNLAVGSYREAADSWAGPNTRPTQWGQARKLMKELAKKYPNIKFTVTGHSLGGTLAQFVSDEPNVARVYAFNAPGLPGAGRIDKKVTHYLSEKSTTKVPFLLEFQVFGEWIEGLGERVTDGHKFRVAGIKGHGGAHMFGDALSDNVGYRLREAEQRLVNGVASYSTGQRNRLEEKRKRALGLEDLSKLNGNYYDRESIRSIYKDTFRVPDHIGH